MKKPQFFAALAIAFFLLTPTFMTGCKTAPPVDWNSRVGNYTFDRAVTELGPPDKSAKLSDGRTVAEWVSGQRRNSSMSIGTGVFSGGYGRSGVGLGVGQTIGGSYRDRVLRLTFDAANRLVAWSKNY